MKILLFIFLMQTGGAKIKFEKTPTPVKLRVVKVIEETYYLLKKGEPLDFEVEGPIYLRAYTRLIFETNEDSGIYKILLSVDDIEEKVYTKKTVVSPKAKINGKRVGKWRSIPINVPPGRHRYTLVLIESSSGDVAVKIKEAKPPEWVELSPLEKVEILKAVEGERIVSYNLVSTGEELNFKVKGPTRIKVISRIHFEPGMPTRGGYTLLALLDGKEILRAPVNTYPSEVVFYKNKKDVIPSRARRFYFDIPEGMHRVTIKVIGTLSRSYAIRLLKIKKGKE